MDLRRRTWLTVGDSWQDPPYDANSYAKIVTYDASPAAGSAVHCIPNARRAWQKLFKLGWSPEGRQAIRSHMRLCDQAPLDTPQDAAELVDWAAGAFDYLVSGLCAVCALVVTADLVEAAVCLTGLCI